MIDISCPKCGNIRQTDISKYLKMDKALSFKATCRCSHVFPVMIERRKHIRKNVNFKGTLTYRSNQYPVKILDISKFGMRIMTVKALNILEGERLDVTFIFDNPGKSSVSK
ncbi:MAG: PilZ domain-containing protein, partial [Desulfobacteraceae bacterium]